jgi:hypothetical protein
MQLTLDFPEPERPVAEPHTGRPQVRRGPQRRVTVLCPFGHLVWSIAPGDWAGSWYQARLTDPAFTVTCHGSLQER